jgi:hypothetical protein
MTEQTNMSNYAPSAFGRPRATGGGGGGEEQAQGELGGDSLGGADLPEWKRNALLAARTLKLTNTKFFCEFGVSWH